DAQGTDGLTEQATPIYPTPDKQGTGSDRLALKSNVGHVDEEMVERYFWATLEERRKLATELEAELRGVTSGGNTSAGGVTSVGNSVSNCASDGEPISSSAANKEECYRECYLEGPGNTDLAVTPRYSADPEHQKRIEPG
ncbi:MAG: hypothetical protein ACJAYU_004211, partial [Bradymonadia bacterium]